MFMGVPYVPFFIGAGGVLLVAMYSGNLLLMVFAPVVIHVMRMMAKRDEMVFRLIGGLGVGLGDQEAAGQEWGGKKGRQQRGSHAQAPVAGFSRSGLSRTVLMTRRRLSQALASVRVSGSARS